jgi:aubergine-like protein
VLQINVKLGCPIWQVECPAPVSKKTMLVGLDVYHKTFTGRKSVAGFVASMDAGFTQFWSTSIILNKGQELAHNIAGYFGQALHQYQAKNGFLPDTIIFYRDGVGESQVHAVYEVETRSILTIIRAIAHDYSPGFAEILINKRIRHRFFCGDPLKNPPSGTVVANTIVEQGYAFKMVAQNVTSGTATPTHYQLIYNSTDWKEETFWQMTYWQCFNYANWQGAVRVPAVVQYAHKLAYMVGEQLQECVEGDI